MYMPSPMIKPPALRPGEAVALVAAADRPHSPGEVQRAVALVTQLGFTPLVYGDVSGRHSAWSAPDEARAETLLAAWGDERVRAVWLLRGGWGAARLLPLLDYSQIATQPKLLIANGEASALLLAIHQRTGLATLHGPELARSRLDSFTRAWLLRLLSSPDPPGPLPRLSADPFDRSGDPITFVGGQAEGRLLGGQLSELASLLGTPDAPQAAGRLLFIALPPDAPYVLERHLTALQLAGLTERSAGIVLSDYPGTPNPHTIVTLTLEQALRYGLSRTARPTCAGLPIGTGESTAALPLGVRATLDAGAGTLVLHEGMVEG